jgi:hypothetical protein
VKLDDPVHNWNVSALNFEHDDLTNPDRVLYFVGQEEEISTVECRFHASTERINKTSQQ